MPVPSKPTNSTYHGLLQSVSKMSSTDYHQQIPKPRIEMSTEAKSLVRIRRPTGWNISSHSRVLTVVLNSLSAIISCVLFRTILVHFLCHLLSINRANVLFVDFSLLFLRTVEHEKTYNANSSCASAWSDQITMTSSVRRERMWRWMTRLVGIAYSNLDHEARSQRRTPIISTPNPRKKWIS